MILLVRTFNGCFSKSYFPSCWKLAKIIAITKSGKSSEIPSNNRLDAHLTDSNLLIKQQFGFRQGHSTVQQIFRITEKAAMNFNRNRSTGLVLLNLEKAFDAVAWCFIHKMMKNGYPVDIVKIVKSFLSSRKAFVIVQGCVSEVFDVPAGVPQGSLLSPHLFYLYINDIPISKNCD